MDDRAWIALQMLAQERGPWQLPRPALRVFFFVAADLDTADYQPVKQTRVARALGITQPAVSRALTVLLAGGYLEAGPSEGFSKTYRLNTRHRPVQGLYTT